MQKISRSVTFALALCGVIFQSHAASGMIRVLKYRPLTEIKSKEICLYVGHEMNKKRENLKHPQNTKDPIVCRLSVKGLALSKSRPKEKPQTLEGSVTKKLVFEKLTPACVSFEKALAPGYALKELIGLSTECSTHEAATRVFGGDWN